MWGGPLGHLTWPLKTSQKTKKYKKQINITKKTKQEQHQKQSNNKTKTKQQQNKT